MSTATHPSERVKRPIEIDETLQRPPDELRVKEDWRIREKQKQ